MLVELGFEDLKVDGMEGGVMGGNIGWMGVVEKGGFEKEGMGGKKVKMKGKWEDDEVVGVMNGDD